MKPIATVYIDAFNLYRRALQGTPYRWLDVRAMCEQILTNFEVRDIKYFTAHVKAPKIDPEMTLRQRTYLEALQIHSGVEIHLGQFRRDPRWMESHPYEDDEDGAPVMVQVRKTEEKGSDVNLATHLVWDALHKASDAFVVLSNDPDLVTPIGRLVQEKEALVGIISPVPIRRGRSWARELSRSNCGRGCSPAHSCLTRWLTTRGASGAGPSPGG